MRSSLVNALAEFADRRRRGRSLRFLQGLSADELRYIADFLGSSLLEAAIPFPSGRAQLAERIARFQSVRAECGSAAPLPDQEHKMIVLLEYLCTSGTPRVPLAARSAGQAS